MTIRLISVIFFLLSFNSYANKITISPINNLQIGAYLTGIGSLVSLKASDHNLSGPAIFLGNAINPAGVSTFQMFLNIENSKIYFIESNQLSLQKINFQTILDPYPQAGGTCTGYAIDDFLQQTNLSGFKGTNVLVNDLSTEEGRSNLLVDSINQYYLTLSHRYSINGIMNSYGKKYGFSCKSFKTDSYTKAKEDILKHLKLGLPVIFSFNIGPNMVNSPFELIAYGQVNPELDNRLWIPRKKGERNSGGHSIVASASFDFNNKSYLVMIDSDWSEPRIWDMDSFLNDKTALSEIEFVSCK